MSLERKAKVLATPKRLEKDINVVEERILDYGIFLNGITSQETKDTFRKY
jgi:hypothetical protein